MLTLKTKIKNVFYGVTNDENEFPIQEKDFSKTELKKKICINVFAYENRLVF